MKQLIPILVIALGLTQIQSAIADEFNIIVTDGGGFSASQFAAFTNAEQAIEAIIDDTDASGFGTIVINATGESIDGSGGVLGSAGPTTIDQDNVSGIWFTLTGRMRFDTADIAGLESNGTLNDVILHEMMHVIGIGTLWGSNLNNLRTTDATATTLGQYTGANALAAYNAEFGLNEPFIPVENNGGGGTANGHWDEEFFGVQRNGNANVDGAFRFGPNSNELMTGFLNAPSFISDTTRGAFEDLGYNLVVAVPEPTAGCVIAMLGLGLVSRRRRNR